MGDKTCYFCSETKRLEQHHIVPKRFGGSDESENLVDVCPTCHSKLEDLYDKRFYDALGVEKNIDDPEPEECILDDCAAKTTNRLPETLGDEKVPVCESHTDQCRVFGCGRSVSRIVGIHESDGEFILACNTHSTCTHGNCTSTDVMIYKEYNQPICFDHAKKSRSN